MQQRIIAGSLLALAAVGVESAQAAGTASLGHLHRFKAHASAAK